MSAFDYDADGAIKELEDLARRVPEAVPKAIKAMSDKILPAVQNAAPVKTGVLKKVIGKTGVRTSKRGNKYQLIFVKNRGLKDRNVFKAVVREFGREAQEGRTKSSAFGGKRKVSAVDPKPFWRDAVEKAMPAAQEAARAVMEKAVENK